MYWSALAALHCWTKVWSVLRRDDPTRVRIKEIQNVDILKAEAVVLPGTLTVPDEIAAGWLEPQGRLCLNPGDVAMVPPRNSVRHLS